jgi:hypothetical protein
METGANILWFAMAFTLVISALVVRQLKMSDWLKMGLAWAAIFALVFLVIRTWQLVA